MKTIQKVEYILTDGKVSKTEKVTEKANRLADAKEVVKKVMDSVADQLLLDTETHLRNAKNDKRSINIKGWVEFKEEKKASVKGTEKQSK